MKNNTMKLSDKICSHILKKVSYEVFILNQKNDLVYFNERAEEFLNTHSKDLKKLNKNKFVFFKEELNKFNDKNYKEITFVKKISDNFEDEDFFKVTLKKIHYEEKLTVITLEKITKLVEAINELGHKEQYLQNLIKNVDNIIAKISQEGIIRYVFESESSLSGIFSARINKFIFSSIYSKDVCCFIKSFINCVVSKKQCKCECRINIKNNEYIFAEIILNYNNDGILVSVIRDITKLKILQNNIENKNEENSIIYLNENKSESKLNFINMAVSIIRNMKKPSNHYDNKYINYSMDYIKSFAEQLQFKNIYLICNIIKYKANNNDSNGIIENLDKLLIEIQNLN